jgi:DNA polymerase-3 subunit delta
MGDESALRMDEVFDAAGEGDYRRLDTSLSRLWAAGTSPVAVLRQAMAHFQRLLMVRAEADEGRNAAAAMKKLRPPLHFSREGSFRAQLSRWTGAKLEEALTYLYEAEALAKTTAVPAEAATGRALLSVAAMAKK